MLVAALSNCHMLSFLHVARLAGFTVAACRDHAEGTMEEIAPGRQAVTKVVLHPEIDWTGAAPDDQKLDAMHHEAHDMCFIANSVKTEVSVAKARSQSQSRPLGRLEYAVAITTLDPKTALILIDLQKGIVGMAT